jgi:ribosomal-protein-alanine N-acetyltransferase
VSVAFLEPFSKIHAPAVQRLAGHPEVLKTTLLPDPYPPDGAEVFADYAERAFVDGRERIFAVVSHADGVVGTCGLRHVEERTAEMGYWIGFPYWGRGYGRFAAQELVRRAPSFGFARVIAFTLASNLRSVRTLESAGLTQIALLPNEKHDRWPKTEMLAQFARSTP